MIYFIKAMDRWNKISLLFLSFHMNKINICLDTRLFYVCANGYIESEYIVDPRHRILPVSADTKRGVRLL